MIQKTHTAFSIEKLRDRNTLSMLTIYAKNRKLEDCNPWYFLGDVMFKMFKLLRLKGFSTI